VAAICACGERNESRHSAAAHRSTAAARRAGTQSRAAATAAVAAARRATLAPSRQATAGVAVLAKISAIGFMANQEVLPGTTVGAFRERVLSALPDLPQLKGTYTVHVGDENVPASDDSSQLAELVNANDTVYLKKVDGRRR
jgi:hypothetical protein